MKKIPSLFKRDFETNLIYNEVTEGCEWVAQGEGIATKKIDGTACMIKDGILYKRYDAKHGKPAPKDGIACMPKPDPITGHWPFWVPVTDLPEDQYYRDAYQKIKSDGTYELCGPKINKNPEGYEIHKLVPHGIIKYPKCPRTFEGIKEFFKGKDIEGIVWYRDNGDMCKIKKRDFGMKRK